MSDELLRAVEVALSRADVWDDPRPGLEDIADTHFEASRSLFAV